MIISLTIEQTFVRDSLLLSIDSPVLLPGAELKFFDYYVSENNRSTILNPNNKTHTYDQR